MFKSLVWSNIRTSKISHEFQYNIYIHLHRTFLLSPCRSSQISALSLEYSPGISLSINQKMSVITPLPGYLSTTSVNLRTSLSTLLRENGRRCMYWCTHKVWYYFWMLLMELYSLKSCFWYQRRKMYLNILSVGVRMELSSLKRCFWYQLRKMYLNILSVGVRNS